jgi:hypothetical protein
VARRDEGGLVSFFRVPREGGDPDPFTHTLSDPLTPLLGNTPESEWMNTPHSQPSPPQGNRCVIHRM